MLSRTGSTPRLLFDTFQSNKSKKLIVVAPFEHVFNIYLRSYRLLVGVNLCATPAFHISELPLKRAPRKFIWSGGEAEDIAIPFGGMSMMRGPKVTKGLQTFAAYTLLLGVKV